ncbi:MAG: sn-glycerol-3-phosphate ABC transporter ATP-binding protein UgpC [Actinobacteria bacterium]|nr:sn-glycerol-3-phosphate ABC transporter ATP-binding protein UgpC [Actinomycetota bacterium]
MATVTFDRVTKRFGDVLAVSELSFEVRDGEFLVLVGPSGCGKTTALRMVAGLEEQTSGDIRIGERVVNDVPPKDRDIAMVFQNYALYPHMSVYENLAFGLKLRGTPKPEIERRVAQVGEILGIKHLLQRKPKELSGGQRQRVAVGRAIAREPKVFLMDEPLSNLDAALRVQTRAELQKLHQRIPTTTVYVTHDQVEAMTMGDRIAVMKDGILQQLASPQVLHERPANLFVAGFIGSPAMNFFPAKLVQDAGITYAEAAFFRAPLVASVGRATGRDVTVGVRPEDIDDLSTRGSEATRDGHLPVEANVEVVEFLGNEFQLHLRARGDSTFVARVSTDTQTQPGAQLRLGFDTRKLHVFDRATEEALQ